MFQYIWLQIVGFTFEEIGCLSSSKSKVLCCHFSSDGKMLASSGHEKKVVGSYQSLKFVFRFLLASTSFQLSINFEFSHFLLAGFHLEYGRLSSQ